jgi:ribosomal protein S18 acetylase RimI-like enzyme
MDQELAISVRRAQPSDAPALAALVNRAYAIEKFFVDGDRTDADEIQRVMSTGAFLVLEAKGALAAAVYVEAGPSGGGYIGMLSVDPALQGMGIGTRLVRIAEAMCEAMGATWVKLKIINLREELGRWYKSLGYREVGTSPYNPQRPVKQPCHFVEMRRVLGAGEPAMLSAQP